jgi:putative ATPase
MEYPNIPLAERMRPQTLEDYVGQPHLVGPGGPLRMMVDQGFLSSILLWGPPGSGKTTLARLLAQAIGRPFYALSAIASGIKDVREVIEQAEKSTLFSTGKPILFIDEIHRFNKAQQDGLLGAVEKGTLTLIGATTENPGFEVIPALLSRCQVYVLKAHDAPALEALLQRALTQDSWLKTKNLRLQQTDALLRHADGDGRRLLNLLELVAGHLQPDQAITNEGVIQFIKLNPLLYDKTGEQHYDIISAFIKSVRGSDPQAALYWMARMIEGGEDPTFMARRLLILASEDIGLANPNALLMATATFQAVERLGMPEGRIPLSECAIYLALSPKSNSAYLAIDAALAEVRRGGSLPVPLHLRNAPTSLMKNLGYGTDYEYPHESPGRFSSQSYLPEEIESQLFYQPAENDREAAYRKYLQSIKPNGGY